MTLKNYIKFFKENSSIKDVILIILAVISIIIWISGTVFAVEEEISWSSVNKPVSDLEFKQIISENTNFDVTNEDFSTYVVTSNSTYTYNYILSNYLLDSSRSKLFFNFSDNEVAFAYSTNQFDLVYSYNAGYDYSSYSIGSRMWIFNFEDKTIRSYSRDIGSSISSAFDGWITTKAGVSLEEFTSLAYKQNLIYNNFFMVLGPIYDNDNTLLNYVTSFKITGNVYNDIQYSGDITFSDSFENWQTLNLSENFYSSGDVFSYYVYAYDYSESGVSRDASYKVKIGDFIFTGDSAYVPLIEEVNHAIKQIDGYMNYVYTIGLFLNDSPVLLRSDLFLVDAKPIVMIPYFKQKYDYIYYGSYIDIGNSSGDIGGGVISPSGDDTNLEGGISGIWQAIVDLPKNLLEGLVGLFVPPSDYFFNDDPDNLGLWQRFSTFFQQKLGFLYDVLAFIPNLISIFVDIIQSFSEDWSIQIPDLTIPDLTGVQEFTFFEGFEWSPYDWVNSREEFRNLYDLYLKIIDFFVYWGLIWYGIKTYNNVMGNVNYDVEGE